MPAANSFITGAGISPMPGVGASGSPMPTGSALSPMPGYRVRIAPPPQLALALRRSNSGIFRDGDDGGRRVPPLVGTAPGSPARNGPLALARWEPQVRVDTVVASLLSSLAFTPANGSTPGAWWHLPLVDPVGGTVADATRLVSLRALGDGTLATAQLPLTILTAGERDDRQPEILSQADGLWPFWTSVTNIDDTNAPCTVELIDVLLQVTHLLVMRFKQDVAVPRPVDLSPAVGPIIATPGHGAFPSGHATVSFMFAAFMNRLVPPGTGGTAPSNTEMLRRLAFRIAHNRVVAGVHFPIDSVAGRLLGETLAAYFHARCTGPATAFKENAGFDANASPNAKLADTADFATDGYVTGIDSTGLAADPLLAVLWDRSQQELRGIGMIA